MVHRDAPTRAPGPAPGSPALRDEARRRVEQRVPGLASAALAAALVYGATVEMR